MMAGNVVSPHAPLPHVYPTASGWGIKKHNKKIRIIGKPSKARLIDLRNFKTWNELKGSWIDYEGSNKFDKIEQLIGSENYGDILHLDSAYKSGCKVFFTRDRGDILAKRNELKKLLKMKIYHSNDDWEEFEKYIEK